MKKRTIGATVAGAALAVGLAGGAVALANGGDDGEGQAKGPDADRAAAAAVKETGGKVNAVERDNEKGAVWEVEVTRPDGSIADVRLDGNLKVIAVDRDGPEGEHEGGGAN
jgi:uncharacterized membrane protein YkoI